MGISHRLATYFEKTIQSRGVDEGYIPPLCRGLRRQTRKPHRTSSSFLLFFVRACRFVTKTVHREHFYYKLFTTNPKSGGLKACRSTTSWSIGLSSMPYRRCIHCRSSGPLPYRQTSRNKLDSCFAWLQFPVDIPPFRTTHFAK